MNNIAKILSEVNGATFIGLTTETDVKLTGGKKNPLQGRVKKITVGSNVMVFQNKNGSSYEAMVQRRLEKEGIYPHFEVGPRKWGTRIPNTPFIEYNGEYYLEVIFLRKGRTHYTVDGVETPKEQINGIPVYRGEADQGGLTDDNKVIIRTYKISSITSVAVDKKVYGELYFNQAEI